MANQSSSKLLHLPPPQFDTLLQNLEAKTPPKTQTMFSMRQVVERLYDFIARSLAHHYSFDELADIIHTSLTQIEDVGTVPEIKGATLKQYFLEVKRDRDSRPGGTRKAGTGKTGNKGARKPDSGSITDVADMPLETVDIPDSEARSGMAKRLPTPKSSPVELAY
jgi:hypothetical protein